MIFDLRLIMLKIGTGSTVSRFVPASIRIHVSEVRKWLKLWSVQPMNLADYNLVLR
jgi:hypothetical protein